MANKKEKRASDYQSLAFIYRIAKNRKNQSYSK